MEQYKDRLAARSPTCDISDNTGTNVLKGTPADEVICGLGGNALINGGGNDILMGGDGNDTLVVPAGRATLNGGAGADKCTTDRREASIKSC